HDPPHVLLGHDRAGRGRPGVGARTGALAVCAENLEIMRRGYERFIATGELPEDIMDPEFVWDMSTFGAWPERQTYEGIEGTREFMTAWVGAWEDWELEVEELRDA